MCQASTLSMLQSMVIGCLAFAERCGKQAIVGATHQELVPPPPPMLQYWRRHSQGNAAGNVTRASPRSFNQRDNCSTTKTERSR